MPSIVGIGDSYKNIMDLLYEIEAGTQVDLSEYTKSFSGFDYIPPFANPNEIAEISEESWQKLFELMKKSDFDVIVVLFGRTINGFSNFLDSISTLYVLAKEIISRWGRMLSLIMSKESVLTLS